MLSKIFCSQKSTNAVDKRARSVVKNDKTSAALETTMQIDDYGREMHAAGMLCEKSASGDDYCKFQYSIHRQRAALIRSAIVSLIDRMLK